MRSNTTRIDQCRCLLDEMRAVEADIEVDSVTISDITQTPDYKPGMED